MTDWILVKGRIESFLKDEDVLTLLSELEAKYIGEFKTAVTDEDRLRAQARLNAQDEFLSALRIGLGRGETREIERERADAKAKRDTPRL